MAPIVVIWVAKLIFFTVILRTSEAAKSRHFNWEVGYIFWSPDCKEGVLIGINDQFPGPTIRAKAGDTIVINLTNKLHTEGVVIHWHGIRQLGTPWADGTAAISQCAINPEETFQYRFKVDKPGTYFYHGHYGMQRSAGLYGSLIVDVEDGEKEPFHYDGEFNLLLSDWWHQSVHEQAVGLSSKPFRWIGEPQSILVNGIGQYNCSLASRFTRGTTLCENKNPQCMPNVLSVLPNKTYRIRLASTTALASLNLAIGNHKMVIVEADGNYVEPVTVEDMDIYSGESYSVLITTNQKPTNYWISLSVRGRLPQTQPALAILNYRPTSASHLPTIPPPISPLWDNYTYSKAFAAKILAKQGSPKPPATSNRRILLLNTQNRLNGYTKWAINNVSLALPTTPYLGSVKYALRGAFDSAKPPENFPSDYDIMKPPVNPNTTQSSNLYKLVFNSTVDIILQNANALNANVSEIHPWHLHGHDFWVLGYGEGKFTEKEYKKIANLKNPPLKNTAVIFPYGWTALRFTADNPGVWAFHCHIEPHLHMGMGVILAHGVELLPHIPRKVLGCGLTAEIPLTNLGYQP